MKQFSLLITLLLYVCIACSQAQVQHSGDSANYEPRDGDEFYFPLPGYELPVFETQDQDFMIDTVVTGLDVPWAAAFLPDGSVLITERPGRLRLVENGELLEEPVQGLPEVHASGQGGLLDVVLHPEYEENGWIYITYSKAEGGISNTALIRARLEGYALVYVEELFWAEPRVTGGRHFGSRIAFDEDGYLYASFGDRGNRDRVQDLSNHLGIVIRLHDDGRVPDDNPFVGDPDARPEIYAYGLRNIQGMQRHPFTGEIWSHKHGPRGGDEINIIRAGLNYGWPEITHGVNYNGTPITSDTARAGLEQPYLHWTPSIAPCGMDFVHGDKYPGWEGDLLVGTLRPQYLHRVKLDSNGELLGQEEMLQNLGRVRDIRQAPDGFIYVAVETGGTLIRLLPVN